MISDILFQSAVGLNRYLNDPFYDRFYYGELRERIIRLRDEAEYIVAVLDTHLSDMPPPEAVLRERFAAARREARRHAENGGGDLR